MIKKLQELMDEASRNLKENNENKFILESCYKDLDRLIDRVENKVEIILRDGNIHATERVQRWSTENLFGHLTGFWHTSLKKISCHK